jgi:phenylacetate-CoA ligase
MPSFTLERQGVDAHGYGHRYAMTNHSKRQQALEALYHLDPEALKELSAKKALKVFETACARIPAYQNIIRQAGLNPSAIKSIEDFKKFVPVLDKETIFGPDVPDIKHLCLDGRLENIRAIICSSGHSGVFSYGLKTQEEIEEAQDAIDFMLDYIFNVSEKKTLLVNCLPRSMRVYSSLVTMADTGVRPDIVIHTVRTFASSFDQTIIVGENSFLKKVLEDGAEAGIDWRCVHPHLVLAEEVLPENMRTYFAEIIGIDPDQPENKTLIGSSFGLAEFGLNLFHETRDLIRLRRLLQRDEKFREALIGLDLDNLPALLQYDPNKLFVEEISTNDGLFHLALTNLEDHALIPLVRYNTADEGICIPYGQLEETLGRLGYEDYLPKIRLPLLAIWGRTKIRVNEGFSIRPEFIKELLYRKKDIASLLTGNFQLSKSRAGLRIEIQAKEKASRSVEFENKLRALLLENIPARIEIIIYPYREFPHGMELNYEKKFKYI